LSGLQFDPIVSRVTTNSFLPKRYLFVMSLSSHAAYKLPRIASYLCDGVARLFSELEKPIISALVLRTPFGPILTLFFI